MIFTTPMWYAREKNKTKKNYISDSSFSVVLALKILGIISWFHAVQNSTRQAAFVTSASCAAAPRAEPTLSLPHFTLLSS